MTTTQFVLDHIISVLGGAGVLVTGLATYLGKYWSNKLLIKEKARFADELQKTKNEHENSIKLLEKDLQLELARKDQFHQISKTTYENIFNNKISVYTDLLKLKTDYDRFRLENGGSDFIDPTDEFLRHFNLFRRSIEENRLYISNELSDKYDDWYSDAASYFQKMDEVEFNLQAHSTEKSSYDTREIIWQEQEPIIQELVSRTFEKMATVIAQIEDDVKVIRSNVSSIENT